MSFVITCIPFQMSIPVFTPLYTSYDGTGTFTSKIFITIPLMASVALLFIQKHKSIITYYKNERWIYAILALVVISICNPYNFAKLASIAFAITMLSYVCFFKLVSNYITPAEVVKAVFASFMFLCVLQFILALLYPLMGVSFVTTLFQAGGEEWSTRRVPELAPLVFL
ncbi:hypothetical protein [Mucilaginibacter antarcticus]|uniref:hypothetical protein n=1 Tax=Mucilaginibacter antarcticus TaxID=1855725 RepID=UPI003635F768